jgi:ketosteroid isomerase-like protein
MPSVEARLQRLEDEAAIRQRLQDYMGVLAARDWDTYLTYFTEDAALVMPEGTVIGHQAIRTRMANASERMAKAAEGKPKRRQADLLSVQSLKADGDKATTTSRFVFIREMEDIQFRVGGSGLYIDKWQRGGDGIWRISERLIDYDMLPGVPQIPRPVRQDK